ncbi:MAG: hypothetical protein DI605_03640 [Sphingomonas sp.]|nr:MAG: hypothetical protein DI605_03640 [Sphingomonas sp.]
MEERTTPNPAVRAASSDYAAIDRRVEAERLIGLAKAMLIAPEEEIAVIYLDHAIDTLQAIQLDPIT